MASASFSGGIALSFFSIKVSYFLLLLTFGIMVSMGQGAGYTAVLIVVQKVGTGWRAVIMREIDCAHRRSVKTSS